MYCVKPTLNASTILTANVWPWDTPLGRPVPVYAICSLIAEEAVVLSIANEKFTDVVSVDNTHTSNSINLFSVLAISVPFALTHFVAESNDVAGVEVSVDVPTPATADTGVAGIKPDAVVVEA